MDEEELCNFTRRAEDFDEDTFCENEGRKQAKILIMKNLYLKEYRLKPLDFMRKKQQEVDDLKYEHIQRSVLLILSLEKSFNRDHIIQYVQIVKDVLSTRSWVKRPKSKEFDLEWSFELGKSGDSPHFNFIFELTKLYSPGQIAQMLWKVKDIQSIVTEFHYIRVTKHKWYTVKNGINYIHKEGL